MTSEFHVPYNPMTKAQSFAKLTSDGMDADRAFVVLAIVAANTPSSPFDAALMAEIRELALAYVEHTGQESLMWSGERGAMN